MFVQGEYGTSLWEFNLRDILRWCQLMQENEVCMPLMCMTVLCQNFDIIMRSYVRTYICNQ